MNRIDAAQFNELLSEIAEAYDHKPLGTGAVKLWWEALEEFPFHDVAAKLRAWVHTKNKFPAIADIRNVINEHAIDKREDKWRADKARYAAEDAAFAKTDAAMLIAKMLREHFANYVKPDPKQWARDILEAHHAKEPLYYTNPVTKERKPLNNGKLMSDLQLWHARRALPLYIPGQQAQPDRTPGEDDA